MQEQAGSLASSEQRLYKWDQEPQKSWVNALQAGNVIQLIPSAFYQAWANVIKEAHINIEYEIETGPKHIPEITTAFNNTMYSALPLESPSRDIRLLELDPGEYDDAPAGRFLLHRLKADYEASEPDFHALSYCWGQGQDQDRIALRLPATGDVAPVRWFAVPREIYKALQRLRRRHKPLRIWVDALCINQYDEGERAQQVKIMGEIYSRAEVHIWLGEDNPGIQAAIRFFREAYNINEGTCPGAVACSCSPRGHMVDTEAFKADMQRKKQTDDITYKSLHEIFLLYRPHMQSDVCASLGVSDMTLNDLTCYFFSHPWFSRVWVLQEALLARNATMYCGKEIIDWTELITVDSYLRSFKFRRQGPHEGPQTYMPRVWSSLIESKTKDEVRSPTTLKRQLSILDIMLEALDMKASDHRDKLFALLSFSKEAAPSNNVPYALRPNYDEANSVIQVFANFTRWHIRHHQSLAVLSTVHYQPTRTWQRVLCDLDPRINNALPIPTWSFSIEGESRWVNASLERQFDFRATGDTIPDLRLLSQDSGESLNLLKLRGVRLATITAITKAPIGLEEEFRYDGTDRTNSLLVLVFHRIFDLAGAAGLWNWISCPNLDQTPATSALCFANHWKSHWSLAKKPRQVEEHERNWTTLDCVDNCFFEASEGFKGLCPWAARTGDLIVLLFGGNVPYLLRPVTGYPAEEYYFLVGECFVDNQGVMEGSYLNDLIGGNVSITCREEGLTEVFVLQ